ncbi:spore germination protein GerPE [Bacillus marinisedimentorum]|uniref:spore germination protein GerPE n=1 Tax=Bacillus marinisedimentorum TaxID=1821260 RepID=UPI00087206EE|nr:spore germination protein GerPE [Bacillus marinisedimentorum]
MYSRISLVKEILAGSVIFSSVFEIGDSNHLNLKSRALAVQREQQIFFDREGAFNYPLFKRNILPPPPVRVPFTMSAIYEEPLIRVNKIDIKGVSSSSALHIGSTCWIKAEARVKHIRQLESRNEENAEEE